MDLFELVATGGASGAVVWAVVRWEFKRIHESIAECRDTSTRAHRRIDEMLLKRIEERNA